MGVKRCPSSRRQERGCYGRGMFSKVLIASRGEITTRFARTCRQLGVHSVAVYSDAKADVAHVGPCDEAFKLRPLKDGSLSTNGIVKLAKEKGVDAVHPGYARADNHEALARALEAEGIAFIGADPDAAAQVSDRNSMRVVADKAQVRCVEREIHRPRAISVLVAADAHGAVAPICEVDRSLGDSTHVLVKETPSPALFFSSDGEAIRLALFDSARRLVITSNVIGLVMVDFLLDEKGRAAARAARPGLPTLHAPYEMVSSVDLIGLQLRIAAGESLTEDFDKLQTTGHAVGVSVLAGEDADLDQPVKEIVVPSAPQGRLRIEPSVATVGAPPSVDDRPLIAKVTAYAAVRHQAAFMVDRSLAMMKIDPFSTNIEQLRSLLGDHCVRAGQYDVGLIGRLEHAKAMAAHEKAAETKVN